MALQVSTHKKQAVLETANALLQAQNRVTTLEIKTALRSNPKWKDYYWDQAGISTLMNELYNEGKFDFVDTGTYRLYSGSSKGVVTPKSKTVTSAKRSVGRPRKTTPTAIPAAAPVVATPKAGPGRPKKPVVPGPKPTRISRKKALELMKNNKGHFFTAVFSKKGGETRTMNCQYLKDQTQSDLGYIKVQEGKLLRTTKDPKQSIRQVNLQTLTALTIAKQSYIIR